MDPTRMIAEKWHGLLAACAATVNPGAHQVDPAHVPAMVTEVVAERDRLAGLLFGLYHEPHPTAALTGAIEDALSRACARDERQGTTRVRDALARAKGQG